MAAFGGDGRHSAANRAWTACLRLLHHLAGFTTERSWNLHAEEHSSSRDGLESFPTKRAVTHYRQQLTSGSPYTTLFGDLAYMFQLHFPQHAMCTVNLAARPLSAVIDDSTQGRPSHSS